MKWLFLIWFLLIALFSKAQNGGQFAQNDVIIVSYLGYENGVYVFKITNKLECDVEVRYRFEQFASVDTVVLASSSINVPIFYNPLPSVSFTVKPIPQTVCILGGGNIDMGLLEIGVSAVLSLNSSNFITNSRNTSGISIYVERGVLKTDIGNNVFPQTVVVYDFNGRAIFRERRIVNRTSQIPLDRHTSPGQNFIIVHIENKLKDVFLLKYYN